MFFNYIKGNYLYAFLIALAALSNKILVGTQDLGNKNSSEDVIEYIKNVLVTRIDGIQGAFDILLKKVTDGCKCVSQGINESLSSELTTLSLNNTINIAEEKQTTPIGYDNNSAIVTTVAVPLDATGSIIATTTTISSISTYRVPAISRLNIPPAPVLTCDNPHQNGTMKFVLNRHLFNDIYVTRNAPKRSTNSKGEDTEGDGISGPKSLYARFGTGDRGSDWKFFNEITESASFELLTLQDFAVILELLSAISSPYSLNLKTLAALVSVESDIHLAVQTVQSTNPSNLTIRFLSDAMTRDVTACLDLKVESKLTRLSLTPDKMALKCFGDPRGNSCGSCGLPANNGVSGPMLLRMVNISPRGPGATIPDDQWRRNQYIFRGSHYYVYLKLKDCP